MYFSFSSSSYIVGIPSLLHSGLNGKPRTWQVWSVFRRNRDFIALRQQLKAMCQQTPQQHRTITTPRNTSAKRTFTAAVGATSADHGKATAAAVTEVAVASATASTAAGSTLKKPPTLKGRTVDVEAVRAVLAGFKFPSKIAIAGPAALKMERRKAFNTFLRALVRKGGRGVARMGGEGVGGGILC